MSVTRGTVRRLHAQIAKALASLPPVFAIVDQHDGESAEAAMARARAKYPHAGKRDTIYVIVDREEGE